MTLPVAVVPIPTLSMSAFATGAVSFTVTEKVLLAVAEAPVLVSAPVADSVRENVSLTPVTNCLNCNWLKFHPEISPLSNPWSR